MEKNERCFKSYPEFGRVFSALKGAGDMPSFCWAACATCAQESVKSNLFCKRAISPPSLSIFCREISTEYPSAVDSILCHTSVIRKRPPKMIWRPRILFFFIRYILSYRRRAPPRRDARHIVARQALCFLISRGPRVMFFPRSATLRSGILHCAGFPPLRAQ